MPLMPPPTTRMVSLVATTAVMDITSVFAEWRSERPGTVSIGGDRSVTTGRDASSFGTFKARGRPNIGIG
jgi:hypothetical protein